MCEKEVKTADENLISAIYTIILQAIKPLELRIEFLEGLLQENENEILPEDWVVCISIGPWKQLIEVGKKYKVRGINSAKLLELYNVKNTIGFDSTRFRKITVV